jgi:phosphohistidine phosphatase
MKTLYLIRHGKGASRTDDQSDRQRKLSKIGEREVKAMSRNLRQRQILPEVILCSPTERACQTAGILSRVVECPPERLTLYDEEVIGDHERLLQLVRSQSDAMNVVMVIGHHPALSAMAHTFVPYFDTTLRTSSVVGIQFACDTWSSISEEAARLLFYDFPARLKANVSQHVQQMLGEHLTQFVRLFLKYNDDGLPKDIAKTIKKSSRRMAKALVEELHTSPMHAVPAEEPAPAIEMPQTSADLDAPVSEPPPAKKRKHPTSQTEVSPKHDI